MAKKIRLFSISDIQLAILKSNPPQLSVTVSGQATSSGWSNVDLAPLEKTLSPDGILDLDFVGEPPDGISNPVLSPVVAHHIWTSDVERLVGVKVYSRSGDVVHLLHQLEDANLGGFASTLALGEEGPPVTTLAFGEEGGPSTRAIGEEGFPTTKRLGEEGPWTFPRENGPTTLAIGEEGPTWRRGEGPKGFVGETDPRIDDPKPPFGEQGDWFDPDDFNPFGRR